MLAVTSNIFGAVFSRLGTATWVTESMLALPLSPALMLVFVVFLLFLLGWPFEWPAIILVFLPIFFPIIDALRPALGQSLGIHPDWVMIWFGTVVAVTMQTAYLSPPVAMSAYYLKQVVKAWSLATIYRVCFEFMVLAVHRDRAACHLPVDCDLVSGVRPPPVCRRSSSNGSMTARTCSRRIHSRRSRSGRAPETERRLVFSFSTDRSRSAAACREAASRT